MEAVNTASIVRGGFYTDRMSSCYEEFLRLKPIEDAIGPLFYQLLYDASKSIIKSVAKMSDNSVLENNTEDILALTDKYAKIYFSMGKDERILIMYRSALYDMIRGYDQTSIKYDELTSNLYEYIKRLIMV